MNQIRDWEGACQRCFALSEKYTMSMLDVSLICMRCANQEKIYAKTHAHKTEKENKSTLSE